MDRKIKAISKEVKGDAKKEGKALKGLLKADRKMDAKMAKCKMMKAKKK